MAETRRVPCLYCGKDTSFREIPNWPNRVVYHASCADPGGWTRLKPTDHTGGGEA